jgi:acyl dehydratase
MDGLAGLESEESRYFEDFRLGERFHAPDRRTEDPLHGAAVLSLVTLPAADVVPRLAGAALAGLADQSSRFLRGADPGDTLRAAFWVEAIEPESATGLIALGITVHNQRRELLMEGIQRWRLRRRNPGPPV